MELLILAGLSATLVMRYGVIDLVSSVRGTTSPPAVARQRRMELAHERAMAKIAHRTGPTVGEAVAARVAARVGQPKAPKVRAGRGAFRTYLSGLWGDSWEHADESRVRHHERKEVGDLPRQRAARAVRDAARRRVEAARAARHAVDEPEPAVDADEPATEAMPTADEAAPTGELPTHQCDGTCRNLNVTPNGACWNCSGRKELVWNFGDGHGHTPCLVCNPDGTGWKRPRLDTTGTGEENRYIGLSQAVAPVAVTEMDAADEELRRCGNCDGYGTNTDLDDPRVTHTCRDCGGSGVNADAVPIGPPPGESTTPELPAPATAITHGGTMTATGETLDPQAGLDFTQAVQSAMTDWVGRIEQSVANLTQRGVTGGPIDALNAISDALASVVGQADEGVSYFESHLQIQDVAQADETVGGEDYIGIGAARH